MASVSVKIAVFAPIPKASEVTATAVNTGDCRSIRNAYRTSCQIVVRLTIPPWTLDRGGGQPYIRNATTCRNVYPDLAVHSSSNGWPEVRVSAGLHQLLQDARLRVHNR